MQVLRDNQEFYDELGAAEALGISSAQWSLFGVVWDSGEVLANYMLDYSLEGKRILEVGCGIALTSLLINYRDGDITATDYHPEAGSFLQRNAQLNNGKKIPYVRMDWGDEDSRLGKFDVIVGSDLLYEEQHVKLLSNFINDHASPNCEVIIVDPGRENYSKFNKEMLNFSFSHSKLQPEDSSYLSHPFKGHIHEYRR